MSKRSVWIAGMAIFAMFFGSGNLVFPIALGQMTGEGSWLAGIGLILTAVLVPFLGVFTMILYRGNLTRFFSWLGRIPRVLICGIIIGILGPLGSLPRCLTISYASLAHYVPSVPIVLFSLVACALVYYILRRKGRFVDVIGYLLTPPLLISLALIAILGFFGLGEASSAQTEAPFWTGLVTGYSTLDFLASFFFAGAMVSYFEPGDSKSALKAGSIGVALLALTYFGFIFLGAHYGLLLEGMAPQQLLLVLAHHILGAWGGLVATIAIGLACLTTAIALASISVRFIIDDVKKMKESVALLLVLAVSVGISVFDFQGIAAYLTPVLFYMYPFMIVLTVVNLVRIAWLGKGRDQQTLDDHSRRADWSEAEPTAADRGHS